MNKKLMVVSFLLCLLFIVSAVSANENIDVNTTDETLSFSTPVSEDTDINQDILESSEEPVLNDGGNGFSDLKSLIDAHIASGEELTLDKDYINNDNYDKNGIEIDGKITINGNNHTIDANQKGRIFNIKDNSNVTLNNITFKNGYYKGKITDIEGGAIYLEKDKTATIKIYDCTFDNNKAKNGGAIFISKADIEIHNSVFINNQAESNGGVIRSENTSYPVKIYNCNFMNNNAKEYGGALSIPLNSEIYYSNFTGNTAKKEGGAINVRSSDPLKIVSHCIFENNNASTYAGAIIFGGGTVEFCDFISNNALSTSKNMNGGAIYVKEGKSTLKVINSTFKNNKIASKTSYGSAIYLGKGGTIENSNFTNNYCDPDAEGYGGTIYSANTLTVTGCEFDNNTGAKNNYNIYQKKGKTLTITSTTFKTINPTITVDEVSNYVIGSGEFDIGVNDYEIKITLKANDTDETSGEATVKNGNYTFSIDKPKPGTYTLSIVNDNSIVKYNSNNYVIKDAESNEFTVPRFPVILTVPSTLISAVGMEAKIKIKLTDENSKPLNGTVTIYINGEEETVTITDGAGYYSNKDLSIDDYPFTVKYDGTETYLNATAEGTLKIRGMDDINHTYTQLQKFIDDTPEGGTLTLPYYFKHTQVVDYDYFPGGVIINKTITIDGNGNYISGEHLYRIFNITADNVVLKNIIFTNGTSDNGGAIYVTSTGSASVENSDFENNTATENGGAIYCDNKIIVSDSTFINNTADKEGGAIFTKDSKIDGSNFYNNSAEDRGGGLYSKGKTIITNSVFDNNEVTNYKKDNHLNRGGSAIFSTGELEIDYTNITNNLKNYVERGHDSSHLIFGAVAFINTTKISNSLFENNGGCYGGAISADLDYDNPADYTFNIDNVTFNNNRGYNGGAIYVGTSSDIGPESMFASDINFTINNSRFNNNSVGYPGSKGCKPAGGAICIVNNHGHGNITSSNFTKNYAHADVNAGGGAISFQDTDMNIYDCIFTQNYANKGGAFEFDAENDETISVLISNSIIDNNTAKTKGGGAIYYASGKLTLLNSNLTNNIAIDNQGGAIYHMGDLYVSYSNFMNNTAIRGGAISSVYVENLEIYNSNFTQNNATTQYGGALSAYGTINGIISNSNFTNNYAKSMGGAVWEYTGSQFKIDNSKFMNNTANNAGGVYIYQMEDASITDSNFTKNTAKTSGGAIYANACNGVTIKDSSFVNNNATSYGGAVYSRDTKLGIADNSQFDGNTAKYGGAIYLAGSTNANIAADFTNNNATLYGGAIMINGVTNNTLVDNSYFNKNIASYGSAIYAGNSVLYVSDTVFARNRADATSLDINITSHTAYYPSNGVINIIFKGCDNIANAIYNTGAPTKIFISNITYEAFIKGKYFNKTTPVDYTNPDLLGYCDDEWIGIHPADGADENADVWQDRREDAQIINVIVTDYNDPSKVVFNQTGLLTDVYGNVSVKMNTFKPGKYKITAEHPLDDYYTQIRATNEFEIFDLNVNKTTNDVKVNRGENVEYTITVDNKGPNNLSDITVEDIIPNGFVFLDNSEGWRIVNQNAEKITFKYIGNNGILESEKSITLKLLFNTTIGGVFNNTALVSSNETTQREVTSNNTTVLVPTHITVDNITVYPGTEVVIPINVTRDDGIPFDGNVTIIFPDGTNQTVEINKGSGNAKWLVPEEYVPEYGNDIKFDGDDYQLPSDGTGTITVVQVPTKVTVGNVTTYPGKTVDIPIEVTADNGLPVNGKVTITLPDGSKQTVEIKNGKGTAKWTLPKDYRPGKYNDNVKFQGDNTYLPSEGKGTIEVLKIPVKIKVGSVTAKPGQTVKIPIKVKPKYGPAFNGKIKVTLPDGTKKTVKIVNGKGIVKWTVPKGYKGTYDVSASFGGNDIYYPADGTGKVKVIPEKQTKHDEKKNNTKSKASHVEYKSKLESNATGNPVYLLICVLALLLNIQIKRRR